MRTTSKADFMTIGATTSPQSPARRPLPSAKREMAASDRGVGVGLRRDDGLVTEVQQPILLGGYAAKQCRVRVQNDFLPLVQTLKWISAKIRLACDARIAFERIVFDEARCKHPSHALDHPRIANLPSTESRTSIWGKLRMGPRIGLQEVAQPRWL